MLKIKKKNYIFPETSFKKQPNPRKSSSPPIIAEKPTTTHPNPSNPKAKKSKTKYVNLYDESGKTQTIMLEGRRKCDCQASEHDLINNCLSCGRIVCSQEGSGPCVFCGELVCTEEEMELIKSKKGDSLKKSLMGKGGGGKGLEEALKHRNKLLEFNDNMAKRTIVIDDEMDYFDSNSQWLTADDRKKVKKLEEEMHSAKHDRRSNRKITLDFAGREVVEEPSLSAQEEAKILREVQDTMKKSHLVTGEIDPSVFGASGTVDPGIEVAPPVFIPQNIKFDYTKAYDDGLETKFNRVQDKEILEMQDMRHCLSMHQPWASLLIAGIKRHEGRVWYTAHRGRLWIASTAKPAAAEDIAFMESFYKTHYNDKNIEFPKQYPTACLLGCVKVEDCLSQEQYQKHFPGGESDNPFVFICEDPQELPINFPIKGTHKICRFLITTLFLDSMFYVISDKLDPKIHMVALQSLNKAGKLRSMISDKENQV